MRSRRSGRVLRGPNGDRQVRSPPVASRTKEQTLRVSGGWGRIRPWRDRADVAHVVVSTEAVLAPATVRACMARARAAGYDAAVTSPLTEPAAVPFLEAGFRPHDELRLLVHDLDQIDRVDRVDRAGLALRRAGRGDRAAVVELDDRAFPPAWRQGASGLREALRATPAVRFRIASRPAGREPVAYAVTGRSGRRGYLQRLAVDPEARGRGYARALVADALRWVRRGGGRRCLVNTQADNHEALALYEACGFRRLPSGLSVLGCAL